jgi:hypothetical protein
MLVHWLTQCNPINPITAGAVSGKISDILYPLIIVKGDHTHVYTTQGMLDGAGYALAEPSDDDLDFHEFAAMCLGMALMCFWIGWFNHAMSTAGVVCFELALAAA